MAIMFILSKYWKYKTNISNSVFVTSSKNHLTIHDSHKMLHSYFIYVYLLKNILFLKILLIYVIFIHDNKQISSLSNTKCTSNSEL